MAPASTQGVKDANRRLQVSQDVTVLNEAVVNELARELIDEFLPHVDRIPVEPEMLEPVIEGFARGHYGQISVAATFGKTAAIPTTPITLHSGGGFKAWAVVHQGQVSLPHPVLFDGLTAFGPIEIGGWTLFHGLAGVERLYAEDGQIYAGLCCIPFVHPNVTKEILNNPVAKRLFPQKEVGPVTFERLLDLAKKPSADGQGPDVKKILLEALQEAALQVKFYASQKEALAAPDSPRLGIQLFLNLPDLRQTIESGAYRTFDFTGILADSTVEWRAFPLYLVPRPENIYFSAGSVADFSMSYEPRHKKTTLSFTHIDADVFLLDWFTEKPMKLNGNIRVDIEAGGRTRLKFDQLQISFPNFPSERTNRNFASITGTLDGDIILHMDEEGALKLDNLDLRVDQIRIATPQDRHIGLGSIATTIAGELNGSLSVSFNKQNQDKLRFSWDTHGAAELTSGRNHYDIEGMDIDGNLLGQIIEQKYYPRLDGSSLYLGATEMSTTEGTLALHGPWLRITGGDRHQKGSTVIREALLQAGAEAVIVGDIPLKPSLYMELSHHSSADEDELVGYGDAALRSESLPLQIRSRAHFRADDGGYAWELNFDEPQIAGALVASGHLRVGREGTWREANSVRSLSKFTIETDQPYSVDFEGENVARDVSIQGTGDDRFVRIAIDAGSLPAQMRGHLVVLKRAENPRLSGQYNFSRDLVTLSPASQLSDIEISGDFITVPLQQITDRPAAQLRAGKITTNLTSVVSGPIAVTYAGSLNYDPETQQIGFSFDSTETSQIRLGPLMDQDRLISLDGEAKLKGTIASRLTPGSAQLSGRRLGLYDGQVFIDLSPLAPSRVSERTPFLDHFWMSADRLRTDLKSIHFAGDGFSISTEIYAKPLGIKTGKGAEKRTLAALGMQRMPLSDPQYWPVLREVSQAINAATTGNTPTGDVQ